MGGGAVGAASGIGDGPLAGALGASAAGGGAPAEGGASACDEASESEVADADVGGGGGCDASAPGAGWAPFSVSPEAVGGGGGLLFDPWSVGASDDSEDIPQGLGAVV